MRKDKSGHEKEKKVEQENVQEEEQVHTEKEKAEYAIAIEAGARFRRARR